MRSIKFSIIGFLIGILISTLFSFKYINSYMPAFKSERFYNLNSHHKIDTLFHNDTTFSLLNQSPQGAVSFTLEYYPTDKLSISLLKGESVKLHKLIFFKNGKLAYLKTDYRDTLKDGHYLYEIQRIDFDTTGRLKSFNLIKDFKQGWSYPIIKD